MGKRATYPNILYIHVVAGANPGGGGGGGGGHLKQLCRAEGGAKIFGVFRVKNHDFTPKNHDFTPKNHIFSNCRGRRENFGVFHVKNHDFTPKKFFFSKFRGCAPPPPPESAPG